MEHGLREQIENSIMVIERQKDNLTDLLKQADLFDPEDMSSECEGMETLISAVDELKDLMMD